MKRSTLTVVKAVPCPTCGAGVGYACTFLMERRRGEVMGFVHWARSSAYSQRPRDRKASVR